MEQKRSGVGLAAAILYIILLLNAVAKQVVTAITLPEAYVPEYLPYRILEMIELCPMVLVIISLFRERRSWMLLAAHVWLVLIVIRDLFKFGVFMYSGSAVNLAMNLLNPVITLLLAAMVAFHCVQALREYAGWTGKVWFVPGVCSLIWYALDIVVYQYENYLQLLRYHSLTFTMNLVMIAVSVAWNLLFCLWLTEPVRHKGVN